MVYLMGDPSLQPQPLARSAWEIPGKIPYRRMIALNQYRFADPAFKGSKEIEPNVVPEPRIGRKVRELVYNRSKVQPHLDRQA
jgi:hypothetical protein